MVSVEMNNSNCSVCAQRIYETETDNQLSSIPINIPGSTLAVTAMEDDNIAWHC